MASNLKTFEPLSPTWMHVCVDMQQMFEADTPWAFTGAKGIIPNIRTLCDLAPGRTVFTRFVTPKNSDNALGRWAPFYERWSEMTRAKMQSEKIELFKELKLYVQRGAQVVDKRTYSPWLFPHLQDFLILRKADTLVITGIETEMCVLATLLGAIDHGYRAILCTDAIASSAPDCHAAVLSMLESRYGEQLEHAKVADFVEYTRSALPLNNLL
jgi:nicotinamidase-related amidase